MSGDFFFATATKGGLWLAVVPLTFGRARLITAASADSLDLLDGW